jgi:hypothetical protein
MDGLLLVFWALILAWLGSVALISFFVIGPHFPGRGATPLAGARAVFFSAAHLRQLRDYRELCVAQGKSLFWWRFVHFFVFAFPFALAIGVALSLWATR